MYFGTSRPNNSPHMYFSFSCLQLFMCRREFPRRVHDVEQLPNAFTHGATLYSQGSLQNPELCCHFAFIPPTPCLSLNSLQSSLNTIIGVSFGFPQCLSDTYLQSFWSSSHTSQCLWAFSALAHVLPLACNALPPLPLL